MASTTNSDILQTRDEVSGEREKGLKFYEVQTE